MRVVLFTQDYAPQSGGIATHLRNLVEHFPTEIEVTVIAPEPEVAEGFGGKLLSYITKTRRNLRAVWEASKDADILWCGNIESGHAELLWLVARLRGIPLVTTAYAMEVTQKHKSFGKRLISKLRFELGFRHADRVVAISRYTKNKLVKRGVEKDKIGIVTPGVCLDNYDECQKEARSKSSPVILSISRLVKRKGFDVVIKAMPEILKKVPSAIYIIGGDGPDRPRLTKLAQQLGLDDRVRFVGFIPEAEKASYYQTCDLFTMPSRVLPNGDAEGFGIVFLEANMFCKPVVAGNSGGIPDAVEDGISGLLVDPTSPKEVADVCIRLLKDNELAERLGQQGRRRAEKNFNWRLLAKKFANELEDIVQS